MVEHSLSMREVSESMQRASKNILGLLLWKSLTIIIQIVYNEKEISY